MDAANEGIHDAQEQLHNQQHAPAPAAYTTVDLFAFDDAPAMGAPAPLPAAEPAAATKPGPSDHMPQQAFGAPSQSQPNYSQPDYSQQHQFDDFGTKEVVAAPERPRTDEVFRQPPPIDARGVSNASAYSVPSFEQEGLMGGTSTSLQTSRPSIALDPSRYAPGSDEVKRVEDLKARAVDAEQIARDAEEARRVLAAQADELRRLADEAEAVYRERLQSTNEHKKPGFLGRGKKKDIVSLHLQFFVARKSDN